MTNKFEFSCSYNYLKCAGIRVQSLKKGQITMDIDLRWGGDPNIVLGVEAAMVANLPIQVGMLMIYSITFFYKINESLG